MDTCFSVQQPFVIDNTNPTIQERKRYIKQSMENKYMVIGYYFHSKIDDSIKRNNSRIGKAKIPEIGIKGTFNKLELSSIIEGFDELF